MARLKSRSGVETLEIPIEVDGIEKLFSIRSPSISAFEAAKDLMDLARAQAIQETLGDEGGDPGLDLDAISARLDAYNDSVPEGETIETMLVGPPVYAALVDHGVDPIMRQHVIHTVLVWAGQRSTQAAAEFWETGDSPKASRARRPQDRKRKRKRRN